MSKQARLFMHVDVAQPGHRLWARGIQRLHAGALSPQGSVRHPILPLKLNLCPARPTKCLCSAGPTVSMHTARVDVSARDPAELNPEATLKDLSSQ